MGSHLLDHTLGHYCLSMDGPVTLPIPVFSLNEILLITPCPDVSTPFPLFFLAESCSRVDHIGYPNGLLDPSKPVGLKLFDGTFSH